MIKNKYMTKVYQPPDHKMTSSRASQVVPVIKGALRAIALIRNNVRLILVFLDVLNLGREAGRGYFMVLINSLADAREPTLSALYAFASTGQRFERKSMKKN